MNVRIEEKPLTAEQQKIIQEGFDRIDEELFYAKNRIRTFSWVVVSPPPPRIFIGTLQARLSYGNFHIVEIFVVEEHRKKRIGSLLLEKAIQMAKEEKATMVTIKTSYPMVKKWYEKCGFTLYNELRGYDSSRIVWSLIKRL
ncbi:MAG: GNAT family N-acetyltransferase [Opitutales bacterium]|nr:GNAT family N-acetyltransferase [Opitutales bacterium]